VAPIVTIASKIATVAGKLTGLEQALR
jgi:hypothetical protein